MKKEKGRPRDEPEPAKEMLTINLTTTTPAVNQPQLKTWIWLAVVYPSWLSRRRASHKVMMVTMLARVTKEECHE